MTNRKAIKSSSTRVLVGVRTSIIKTGKTISIKSNTLSFSLIKTAIKTSNDRKGILMPNPNGMEVLMLKRTNAIRSGKVAFYLNTFTKISPRKRPWDGVNRRNAL